MAIQTINIGSAANDGTGDDLREAFVKVNANFSELDQSAVQTAQNLGSSGGAVFKEQVSNVMSFRRVVGGSNINITELDSTLVMMSSEFGRTPKINKDSGRDHYPRVFSVALAGGGITRGQVYGASDAFATAPEENPLSVEDLATTVYDRIGIVADKELMAPGDRPMEIVDGGKVIKELCV